MFYKTVHDLAWKRIVTCIRVLFKLYENESWVGMVLFSCLFWREMIKKSPLLQYKLCVAHSLRSISVFCHCSWCVCLLLFAQLTLVHSTDARRLIFPFGLMVVYNVFLHFWACFLLWWSYIISFCSKFSKLFYGRHLGNSRFYLI